MAIARLELAALQGLTVLGSVAGCRLTISGAKLPALSTLEVANVSGAATLKVVERAALPQLSRLLVRGDLDSRLRLQDVDLPALGELVTPTAVGVAATNCALGAQRDLQCQQLDDGTVVRALRGTGMAAVRAPRCARCTCLACMQASSC